MLKFCSQRWANLRPSSDILSSSEGSSTVIEGKVSLAIMALVVGSADWILMEGILH